jgi:hypothetical protein
MHARLADSLANTPNVTNSPKSLGNRGTESASYLSAMGDPLTGVAPKKYVTSESGIFLSIISRISALGL